MGMDRPKTGPLTRRQTQMYDLLAADRRPADVAAALSVTRSYVSDECRIGAAKLGAKTVYGGLTNYATAHAYIKAAELIETGRPLHPESDEVDNHVWHVLDGLAKILRERAAALLPK